MNLRTKIALVVEESMTRHTQKIHLLALQCIKKGYTSMGKHASCSFNGKTIQLQHEDNHGIFAQQISEKLILCCMFYDGDYDGSRIERARFYLIDSTSYKIMRTRQRSLMTNESKIRLSEVENKSQNPIVASFLKMGKTASIISRCFDYIIYELPNHNSKSQYEEIYNYSTIQHNFDRLFKIASAQCENSIQTLINEVFEKINSEIPRQLLLVFRNSSN